MRKNVSSQKSPKIPQKFTSHRKTQICEMSKGFWHCLKRERDIRIEPTLSGGKTAFRCIPALRVSRIYLFIFIYLFIYLFIHLFIYLFIYLFITSYGNKNYS